MKLWEKGFEAHHKIEKFTIGNDRELDLKLAKFDVLGNIAHVKMLEKSGYLTEGELKLILDAFKKILGDIENECFFIEDEFEDIHSKIEFEITRLVGDAAKKIHTGRSRNDQVLVDLHLYLKSEIIEIKELLRKLFDTLIELADRHKKVLMPGYTHYQVAMPSSFGLWFSAYAESMIDDVILLNAVYEISDQNPLGSAAGYGSSFDIDRHFTTELLGFKTLRYNVVAAQMSRGKLENMMAFAISSIASTLSRFAMDIVLYNSQNFKFISFPKELTTGSSIMPHKQNPDVFELIRANCNKLQTMPIEISMVTNNLPSGYHRDFQILKQLLMNNVDSIKENLSMAEFMIGHIEIKQDILSNPIYKNIYSVEEVNKLVNRGYSFRDAYREVAGKIANNTFIPDSEINHKHQGSIGNLCLKQIIKKMEVNF